MIRLKTLILSLLFIAWFSPASAQETVSRIEKLDLGRVKSQLSILLPLQSAGSWGKVGSARYYPWLSLLQNPAFTTGFSQPAVMLRWWPPYHTNAGRWVNLDAHVRPTVDGIVRDYSDGAVTPHYPNLDILFGGAGGAPEGIFLFPFGRMVAGLTYFRPLLLDASIDVTGIQSSISTLVEVGGGSNQVLLNSYLDATTHLRYGATSAGLFLAWPIGKKGGFGVHLERRFIRIDLVSDWNVQGAMLYNGREYLFNDPETLWPNDIRQRVVASYRGPEWVSTWGGWLLLPGGWIVDVAFRYTRQARLEGATDRQQHTIPALNTRALVSGGGVEEILDPVKLDLSRLTYTEAVEAPPVMSVEHDFPDELKIGVLRTWGRWAFYFADRIRFGRYSLRYDTSREELILRHELSLFVARGHAYARMGYANLMFSASENQDLIGGNYRVPLPVLALGYGRPLRFHLNLVASASLLPLPGFAVSLQYGFLTRGLPGE